MSRKRRRRKRSHTNKYAEQANIDFKQKKQQLSESDRINGDSDSETKKEKPKTTKNNTKKDTAKVAVVKEEVKETKEKTETKPIENTTETEITNEPEHKGHKDEGYYKNIQKVISEKRERSKEMGISQRVKRGMVFWYDVDPTSEKNSEHMITVDGTKYHDYIMYGNRPWVVVSCEENNVRNQMVTVVPMSTGKAFTSRYNYAHVDIFFAGKDTCVMCEQLRTINAIELKDYISTLDDSVMDKIEDAIMFQTGIKNKIKFGDENTKSALEKIEHIIEGIIRTKINEVVTERTPQKDIEDAVVRLSDSIESMFQDKVKGFEDNRTQVYEKSASIKVETEAEANKESEIDKFYKRYPEEKKESHRLTISTSGDCFMRRWDKKAAQEFINDFDKMDADDVMKKWGYRTRKTCMNMKYYLQKKYDLY